MGNFLKAIVGFIVGALFMSLMFILCFRWEIIAGEEYEKEFLGISQELDAEDLAKEGNLDEAAALLESVALLRTDRVVSTATQELDTYSKLFIVHSRRSDWEKADEAASYAIEASKRALRTPLQNKQELEEYLSDIPSMAELR